MWKRWRGRERPKKVFFGLSLLYISIHSHDNHLSWIKPVICMDTNKIDLSDYHWFLDKENYLIFIFHPFRISDNMIADHRQQDARRTNAACLAPSPTLAGSYAMTSRSNPSLTKSSKIYSHRSLRCGPQPLPTCCSTSKLTSASEYGINWKCRVSLELSERHFGSLTDYKGCTRDLCASESGKLYVVIFSTRMLRYLFKCKKGLKTLFFV